MMKKVEREIYLVLGSAIDWGICSFCRDSQFEGSSCDGDGELYCKHPINLLGDNCDMGCPGEDCWGFNPKVNVRDTADIVGCILANFDPMKSVWWKERGGQIKVAGLPPHHDSADQRLEVGFLG